MEEENIRKSCLPSFFCCSKQKLSNSTTSTENDSLHKALVENHYVDLTSSYPTTITPPKPGWKAVPYILGNEAIQRLATFGLTANFMVYLVREFQMDQVEAANILNGWNGASNLLPLLGAFLADTYLGKYLTILFASFAALPGMVIITLTATIPQLRPPKCSPEMEQLHQCSGYTEPQLWLLLIGMYWLAIGAGGVRPCTIPFGIDQFDTSTSEGRRETASLCNCFYTIYTLSFLLQTVVVYIQYSISWSLGFGIPTFLMLCSILLFLAGSKFYVYEKPEGSIFSGIVQVFVAAYEKRHHNVTIDSRFFDPPFKDNDVEKLPLSTQFRFLNNAALIEQNKDHQNLKLDDERRPNPWRLCSTQQVEEVKCLIKIIPIWASGIICFLSMTTQGTFTISQAMKMDLQLGPKFQIPPGSLICISYITIAMWLPLYDAVFLPSLRKVTKTEHGLATLQRIGIGNVCSILCMVVAGLVERVRRNLAMSEPHTDGVAPMSAMWLAPQLTLLGLYEVFSVVGQIEFYNNEFPHRMRSIGNSLLYVSIAGANYLSSLIVDVVHCTTRKHGQPDWLTNDINQGRLDYFYFLIAGLGALNFVYYLFCSSRYQYKSAVKVDT